MTDYFLLFDLPRRPRIDLDKLKEAYVRRTARHQEKKDDPVVLNEAFRILADPVSRLGHLLALESASLHDRVISPEVERWFGRMAETVHRFDQTYYQLTQESLHLLRAVKLQSMQESLAVIEELTAGLSGLHESLLQQLREIDEGWPNNRSEAIPRLAQLALDLTFTQKWSDELRERKLRFDELG
jgi:hypothetical protein